MDTRSTILGKRRRDAEKLGKKLRRAVRIGDHSLARRLIEHGAPADYTCGDGKTTLHVAVFVGNLEMVQLLLTEGVDKAALDTDGRTPLRIAVILGKCAVAEALLDENDDLGTHLHTAAVVGNVDMVQMLVSKGADKAALNTEGQTPLVIAVILGKCAVAEALLDENDDLGTHLHTAAVMGNVDMVQMLVSKGADKTALNIEGRTPLMAAIRLGRCAVTEALLDDNDDLDAHLHTAAGLGNVDMVQMLVSKGADKDAVDSRGWTPLFLAAVMGFDAVAEVLFAAGADASLRRDGVSALDMAAEYGNVRVLAVFVRCEVDVNDAGSMGTALHHAARESKQGAIDLLVAAGANTEARDMRGCTPLHTAAEEFGLRAAVALLKHGAVINARDEDEQTPLHLAAGKAGMRGAVEMVDLLLRWGADETATDDSARIPAFVAGNNCSDMEEVGAVERIRKLLADAPSDRAWRRRGLLVASRTRPQMVLLGTSTRSRAGWVDLMGRVLGLVEEGVFRTIVGYL